VIAAIKSVFLILSALFPIVDPLGGAPIFLTLTREYSRSDRRLLSWRIAVNSFFLLIGSYFVGTHILSFFGISLPVVQVGGGLVVVSAGWTLLKQKDDDDPPTKDTTRNVQPQDPLRHAFYPLTLPLTVGPGSISIAITLGANAPYHHGFNLLAIVAAIVGCALLALSHAAHVVFVGVHRGANSVEWVEHAAGFRSSACALSTEWSANVQNDD